MQGIQCLTAVDAEGIIGADHETHRRDLFTTIERGDFPRWRVRVMIEREAEHTSCDPFDLTKIWPHGNFPLIKVGVQEFHRNPDNSFAEGEQSAFSPAKVVPGISHSPDKMLQFRIFAYGDAHRYRLGVNADTLAVNAPRCPYANYYRDGAMRFDGNAGGAVSHEPNSFGGRSRIRR